MGVGGRDDPAYYMLDVAQLPDVLYKPDVPAEKWVRCSAEEGEHS